MQAVGNLVLALLLLANERNGKTDSENSISNGNLQIK